jgi:uncharacterized membrane protein
VAQRRWWRLTALADGMRTRLWPIPLLAVVLAAVLGVLLPALDERVAHNLPDWTAPILFGGGSDAARAVLSSIAGSLITVTALTFSLTVVTLQLASSQFSPRLLRTFTRDRAVHATLGLFLATFTYSLVVLRTVRSPLQGQQPFVPDLAVTLAVLLALASVVTLVLFLAHLVRQIRVETMLRDVHVEATTTIGRVLGDEVDAPSTAADLLSAVPDGARAIPAPSSGFLDVVDENQLLSHVVEAGALAVIIRTPGDQLVEGTPAGYVWSLRTGPAPDLTDLVADLAGCLQIEYERTPTQDVALGLRQLTDVAVKALSPGINDPTTAVHALGHGSSVLCQLVTRRLGPRLLRDGDGVARVSLARPDLPDLLDLVIAQPARYGAGEPAVMIRLLELLREVAWTTDLPAHRAAVADQRSRVRQTLGRQSFTSADAGAIEAADDALLAALEGRWADAP